MIARTRPYIPLYFSDETVAISAGFALPGYTAYDSGTTPNVPYTINITASS